MGNGLVLGRLWEHCGADEEVRFMRLFSFLIAALATALVAAGMATAATTTVSPAACQGNGGDVYRPAGSTIVIRGGWGTTTRGLGMDFLSAQTTTLTVNGAEVSDTASYYALPEEVTGGWLTWMTYPTGITLTNPGDTMTFDFAWAFSHPLIDGASFQSEASHRPVFFTGLDFGTCMVHAF